MGFNPTNLGEFLSGVNLETLQETFHAPAQQEASWNQLSTDAFPLGTPGISLLTQGLSVEDFLKMIPEQWEERQANLAPAIAQKQHLANSSENHGRPVNGREIGALLFTFGNTVGNFLIEAIKIKPGHDDTVTGAQMSLPPNYDSENLKWLGEFIGKAARAWQQRTGRYTEDDDEGYDGYDYKQLYREVFKNGQRTLDLNGMEHAEAVKHWFYVNYGLENNLIGPDDVHRSSYDRQRGYYDEPMGLEDLWAIVFNVLDLDNDDKSKFEVTHDGEEAALRNIVNNHYGCVIKEIRDAKLLPRLVPTADTQITTLGTIKAGV